MEHVEPPLSAEPVLHLLTLQVPAPRADEVAEWLAGAFGLSAVQHHRRGAPSAWVEVMLPSEAEALLVETSAASALPVEATRIQIQTPRDWVAACQVHFPVAEFGSRLRVVPAHLDPRPVPLPGRTDVVVQCGLSFGTGQHFTTRFCLEALERLAGERPGDSVLDVGTGTGVLALAASALGFSPVEGTDFDPDSVAQARENAALNPALAAPRFVPHDLAAGPLPGPAGVVVANLFSRLLTTYARRLDAAARHRLVLTGIQEPETDEVLDAYRDLGWNVAWAESSGEWSGLVLRRSAASGKVPGSPMPSPSQPRNAP